jgi:hypothetical protein
MNKFKTVLEQEVHHISLYSIGQRESQGQIQQIWREEVYISCAGMVSCHCYLKNNNTIYIFASCQSHIKSNHSLTTLINFILVM